MPQLVERHMMATELRKGDLIGGTEVVALQIATKYVHVTTSQRKFRKERDEIVLVTRTEATPEEKAADRRMFGMQWLGGQMRNAFAAMDTAVAKLADNHAVGYRIDHWAIADVMKAAAELELWANVARTLGDGNGTDIFKAVKLVGDQEREALLSNRYRGQSTSSVANAHEEFKREAARAFLNHSTWAEADGQA